MSLWVFVLFATIVRSETELDQSRRLWRQHIDGHGTRVGVVDSGWEGMHALRRLMYHESWIPHDRRPMDKVGHGTHVAGVLASSSLQCPGIAPEAHVYMYRLFETARSNTEDGWFLDAYNHAIHSKLHVLNLSHGDPRPVSAPMVDKIDELVANGITVVAATGNYGTRGPGRHTHPASQLSVIAVGSLDYHANQIAPHSSYGLTAQGNNFKPDLVASGVRVDGTQLKTGGCVKRTGTSEAAPVVSGAAALLQSATNQTLNPGTVRQLLMSTAQRLPGVSILKQGAGKIDITAAVDRLLLFRPHVSVHPPSLDLVDDCVYLAPFCHKLAFGINMTLISSLGVSTCIDRVQWEPHNTTAAAVLTFAHSTVLWPYSGYLHVHVRFNQDTAIAGEIVIYTTIQNETARVLLKARSRNGIWV